jgi:hypothetical protein
MSQFITLIKQALRERGQSHVVLDDEELLVCACGDYTGSFDFSFTPCNEQGEAQPLGVEWEVLRCDSCERILRRPDPAERRAVAVRVLALAQEAGFRCAYVGLFNELPPDGATRGHHLLVALPLPLALVADLKQSLDLLVLDVPVRADQHKLLRTGAGTSTAEVFFARPVLGEE